VAAISPNVGSTGGGVPVTISGTGFESGAVVRIGGLVVRAFLFEGTLYLSTPPHEVGSVDVVVTNSPGAAAGTLAGGYTYVSPDSFDFNGDWDGGMGYDWQTPVRFTIRNNVLVSFSCGDAFDLVPFHPTSVVQGEFRVVEGRGALTGRIASANYAVGTVDIPPCTPQFPRDSWEARKR
jgi:IPT/TIG domain